MKILLSNTKHKNKPAGNEIGRIKKEALNNMIDMSVVDIANEIGNNGIAFFPAILQGGMKRDNFVEMQWFALDFDNENGDITFKDILRTANDYGIAISFAYVKSKYFSTFFGNLFPALFGSQKPALS